MKHSVFQFNLEAICSLSKYSELPKKDSHLKYNLEKIFFQEKTRMRGYATIWGASLVETGNVQKKPAPQTGGCAG